MILLYLVARCRFEKKSGNIKNCERWSDMLNEMFPEIALLTRVGKVYPKIPIINKSFTVFTISGW